MKHYNINDEERSIVKKLTSSRIPSIFKNEYIDYLLMIENVDFYICEVLLKGKKMSEADYNEAISDYTIIMENIDKANLDSETKVYFHNYKQAIEIMKKYYKKV